MNSFFSKEILAHRYVLGALGAAVVIAGASILYYVSATREPEGAGALTATSSMQAITTSGIVEPAQNPNLSFAIGGRVARVNASVGQNVGQGALLASLDTSVLSAQWAGANAALKQQQAKLASLKAPARSVDVDVKQTAVATAQATLDNYYATVPTTAGGAYDTSFSGMSADTDSLFNQPNSPINPDLAFTTSNSTVASNASQGRLESNQELATWKSELLALPSDQAALDLELTKSLAHLAVLHGYADTLLAALGSAIPSGSFTSATIAAAQTSVGGYRDALNAQVAALQTLQKNITTGKLGVRSAQDTLNQTLAGATQNDIAAQEAMVEAAQASLANINAQIGQAEVVAPYAGTVGSVQVKVGDTVTPGQVAVTLNPHSQLQVTAYVSESQAGQITAGNTADVTLDAYGSNRHFAAVVAEVDHSPTMQQNVPAYKITLQFAQNDPAISSGMTANIIITPATSAQ